MGQDTNIATVPLPARLDTDAAPALREALLAKRGAPVDLDASEVTRLGSLCLTVLLSAARDWEQSSTPLSVQNPSEAFAHGCARLGVPIDAIAAGGAA